MYDELVKALRETRERVKRNPGVAMFVPPYQLSEAADAIEELQADKSALNGTVTNLLEQIKDLGKPRWIPVTEQLPEDDTHVLGWDGERVRFVYVVTDLVFDAFAEKQGITHWMPLPQPPKEET